MPTYFIDRYYITLYMSNMDVGSNLQWSTASTMTSWHHFCLTVTKNYQNLTKLQQCNDVRCKLIERWTNTLYMFNADVGSNQRWSTPSTMTSCHHFHSTVTQNCQNLTQLQLCSNSVRVHSYAYVPHWKMLKHFRYIHYGCGKQSALVYSLNHYIMASFPLDCHRNCQNLTQLQLCSSSARVHSYAYAPHWKMLKYFIYVQYGCGNHSRWVLGLIQRAQGRKLEINLA